MTGLRDRELMDAYRKHGKVFVFLLGLSEGVTTRTAHPSVTLLRIQF